MFFHSSFVLFWWACVNCSFSFPFIADRSAIWCGLLLMFSMCFKVLCVCCVVRVGILHTFVVTSGYLTFCRLSIVSGQSAHSPIRGCNILFNLRGGGAVLKNRRCDHLCILLRLYFYVYFTTNSGSWVQVGSDRCVFYGRYLNVYSYLCTYFWILRTK